MSSRLRTVKENDTLLSAAREMARHDVGALLVCDEQFRLKGILTDRDIIVRAIAQNRDPATTTVGEIETTDPICVEPDETIERIEALMAQHRVRRIPVTAGSETVGIVTQADVARTEPAERIGHVVTAISTPTI